jgi:glycosyltransferase involved in cell wall biosynthesis
LGASGSDVSATAELPKNVVVGRVVSREALPAVLSGFSVGIIPYHLNGYTKGVFPMKLFEYLASGLPVVSTPLPSLVGEVDHVSFAAEPREFVEAIEAGLKAGRDPTSPATIARREYAMGFSWTRRAQEARVLIDQLRRR